MKPFAVKNGQTFVFIGDSITDCGRRDSQGPFGSGYAKQTIDLITARYPERRIRYFNEGISGDTVEGLRNRWQDDVLRHKPDWVSIKIGINDLHRKFNPAAPQLPPARYEMFYRQILELTQAKTKARIVLIDPFYLSTDTATQGFRTEVLQLLPQYIRIVHRLAKQYGALSVHTHDAFQEQLRYRPADTFCPEPVHPNVAGHLVIAHSLLQTLGW